MAEENINITSKSCEDVDIAETLSKLDLTRTLRLSGLPLSVQYNKIDYGTKVRELVCGSFNLTNENIENILRIPVPGSEGHDAEIHMVILFKSRVHRNRVFQQRVKLSEPIQVHGDANPLGLDGSPKRMTRSAAKKTGESPEKAVGENTNGHEDTAVKVEDEKTENVAAGHEKVAAGPEKVAAGPEKVAGGPEKVAAGPEKVAGGPEKVAAGPEKVAGGPEKVAAGPEMVAGVPEKVENGPEKVDEGPEKMEESAVTVDETIKKVENVDEKEEKGDTPVSKEREKGEDMDTGKQDEELEFDIQDDEDMKEEEVAATNGDDAKSNNNVNQVAEAEGHVGGNTTHEETPNDTNNEGDEHDEGKDESGGQKKLEPKSHIDWAGAPEFQWKKITPEQHGDKFKLVLENVSLSDFFHPFMYQVIQRAKGVIYECHSNITKPPVAGNNEHNVMGKGCLTLTYMSDNQAMFNAASSLVFFRSPGNRRVKILLPQTNATTKMRSMLERRMGHVIDTNDSSSQLMIRKIADDVDEEKVKEQFVRFKEEIKAIEFRKNAHNERCALLTLADPQIAAIVHIYHDWVSLNENAGFSRVYHMSDIMTDELLPKFEAKQLRNSEKMKRKAEEAKVNAADKKTEGGRKSEDKEKGPEAKKARTEETKKEDSKVATTASNKDSSKRGSDKAGFKGGRGRGASFQSPRGNDRRGGGSFRGSRGSDSFRGSRGSDSFRDSRGSDNFRGSSSFRGGRGSDNFRGGSSNFRGSSRGSDSFRGGSSTFRPSIGSNAVRATSVSTGRGGGVRGGRFDDKRGGRFNASSRGGRGGMDKFDRNSRRGRSSPPTSFNRSGRDDRWQGGVAPFTPIRGGSIGPGAGATRMQSAPMSAPAQANPSYQDLAGMLMQQQQTLDYQNQLIQQQQVISELAGRLSGPPAARIPDQSPSFSAPPGRPPTMGGGYQRGGGSYNRY